MKSLLLSFAGTLLALILFFIILPLAIISMFAPASDDGAPSRDVVLALDLRTAYPDRPPTDGIGLLFEMDGFVDVLTKLHAAAEDDQVKGLIIRANELSLPSSRAEELRTAIKALRANDKYVIAHSQGFFYGAPAVYRAISAADEIWMQPGTDFSAPGIALESMFFKGLFDKLGVTAEIIAFKEFKNAPNAYTETSFTQEHELALQELADDFWTISVNDIAADRSAHFASPADLRAVLEDSPMGAKAALDAGLIDELGWPEDAERAMQDMFGAEILKLSSYNPRPVSGNAPRIALIASEGPIVTGSSGENVFNLSMDNMIASDTVAKQIYAAGADPKVRAILFRVDSPGGSPTASDQIWRAIEFVQQTYEKPVVVSMGTVAASGGYYVAMGADRIVASETTITGSIGVYGGRFALAEGLEKIGITTDSVEVGGPYTNALTSMDRLTNTQRDKLYSSLERTYDRFISLVAEGRGLTIEQADAVAKGRVWSGVDAKANGLVDDLGGLMKAIDVAKEEAGIDADAKVGLVSMDVEPPSLVQLFGPSTNQEQSRANLLSALKTFVQDPQLSAAITQFETLRTEPKQAAMPVLKER